MGKNTQIHLFIETEFYDRLKKEAFSSNISFSELVRRKLEAKPISEEIILIRKLRGVFENA